MTSLRVLHVITTAAHGGAENQLLTLARAQVEAGHEVAVIALKDEPEMAAEFESAGCVFEHACHSGTGAMGQLKATRRAIRQLRPNVVHAHLPQAELVVALASPRRTVIVNSRHVTPPFWPDKPPWMSRTASRVALYRSSLVIAISAAVEAEMRQCGEVPASIPSTVIRYGIDPEQFSRRSSGREPAAGPLRRVGTLARLVPQKSLPTLIQAVRIVKEHGQALQVDIVGEGPLRADLERKVHDFDLDGEVHLPGRTLTPAASLSEWDCFVLPSEYEGLGLVLLEAMSCDVPVVCADNTAMIEVVEDQRSGLTFRTFDAADLADKIEALNDPELRNRLVIGARERLRTAFSVDGMRTAIDAAYQAALSRRMPS